MPVRTAVACRGLDRHHREAPLRLSRQRRDIAIPEAAGVELGPPVLLEGEDLAHYERLLAQVTAEPWLRAISTRPGRGRDRHDRIPVILEAETSVLRAAALGRLEPSLTTISRHRGGRCGEKTIEQRD